MAYTLHQQEITNGIYCRLTGADSRVATAELQDLVRRDLLEQTGTRRWTSYRLSPSASRAPEAEQPSVIRGGMTAADRQERICNFIAERGKAATRTIVEELGIPPATVRYDLRRLVEAGRIERTAEEGTDPRNEYQIRSGL